MAGFTKDQEEHLSFIRHEIKNPLSTMKLIVYMIDKKAKENAPQEVSEQIKKLEKKIDDVVALVDSLLKPKA